MIVVHCIVVYCTDAENNCVILQLPVYIENVFMDLVIYKMFSKFYRASVGGLLW